MWQAESSAVRERLQFVHSDFLSYEPNVREIDTIVMSEVLEHLVQPEQFVERAMELLSPGGTLIVTVPFGINDFIDHKHTFYLAEPYRLIARHFEIVETAVLGKWLGIAATRRSQGEATETPIIFAESQVRVLEQGFFQLERTLTDALTEARAKLDSANLKYREATSQISTLKQKLAQEEAEKKKVSESLKHAEERFAAEMSTLRATLDSEVQQSRNQRDVAQQAELAAQRMRVELEFLRQRAQESDQKWCSADAQVHDLLRQLSDAERQREAASREIAELTRQLAASMQAREEERDAARREIDALAERGRTTTEARHEAEKAAIRLEAERELLAERLSELGSCYREKDEQAARYREDLAQAKAVCAEYERRIAEAARLQEQTQADGEERLTTARQALSQWEQRLADFEVRYAALQDQLRAMAHELDSQQRLRRELESSKDSLANQLDQALRSGEAQLALMQQEAHQKFAAATEAIRRLESDLTAEKQARESQQLTLRHTRERLEQANLKYRAITAEEVPRLKTKLEEHRVAARDAARALEQTRLALQQSHKDMASASKRLQQLERQKAAAEEQVSKTRATLSFQLGYLLLHSFKSLRGIVGLPGGLLALRKEALRRRKGRTGRDAAPIFDNALPVLPTRTQSPASAVASSMVVSQPIARSTTEADAATERGTVSPRISATLRNSKASRLRMACIMDEFTFGAYQHECDTLELVPTGWEAALAAFNPELLFVESAWRGKDGLWGSKVGHTSRELQGIVRWCREHGVPTVFWNKEDPVHFETFLTTAKLFDFVFTTDIDCIHRYKAALGHDRVFLLPFACQPAIHNPIETFERKDAVSFAGAYYVRYPERTRDLETFIAELPSFKPVEIFDRNYGKNDPQYQFPASYQPYIVGTLPFGEIDKAYKGYRYAINLNSIKQSQTMFARRVFELLASNTLTVSNYSRGVRLLFGDLVISSDKGSEVLRLLQNIERDTVYARKLRLAGVRKAMSEHTYGHRLAYVLAKVAGQAHTVELPRIAVIAKADTEAEAQAIIKQFEIQTHRNRTLYLITDTIAEQTTTVRHVISMARSIDLDIASLVGDTDLVAGWVSNDYYGPNYLLDLALATRYSDAKAIGKAAHYGEESGAVKLVQAESAFRYVDRLPVRAAVARADVVARCNVVGWLQELPTQYFAEQGTLLAIDEFNYCRNFKAVEDKESGVTLVSDLGGIDLGLPIDELHLRAEKIRPAAQGELEGVWISGSDLSQSIQNRKGSDVQFAVEGQSLRIASSLDDGKHEYFYATRDSSPTECAQEGIAKVHLDVSPGLNVQLVLVFLDAQRQKISHVIKHANRNEQAPIPAGTSFIRLGLRVYGGGNAHINGLLFGEKRLEIPEMLQAASHLVLTNHYPSYEDLYRNGFVHSRVRAYRERRVRCDVFRFRAGEAPSYHEFEGVDVVSGSAEVLRRILDSGRHQSVLVHFLDAQMWEVLRDYVDRIRVIVWVHGAEIQPWHRRIFNYKTDDELARAKELSDARMAFWRGLLRSQPANLKLVFVSQYFADEVMEDLGFRLDPNGFKIIHNPIDTAVFEYVKKPVEQRAKVLSIRPYASQKYANDLSVAAIEWLSERPCFNELEFRMIGDGPLFEATLEPLRRFPNVLIERRFLTQSEIAELHREYGVFLCPTRMDAQGVSRDEAMSSGLVPVTNAVTAIPEFVDEDCGVLAADEDAIGMAKGIEMLYCTPELFVSKSAKAAERVRAQSSAKKIVTEELRLIGGASS